MEIFLTILGILGVSILSIFTWLKKIIFKRNIEFHEILKSFPLISESRIKKDTQTTVTYITQIQISKEFTKFVEKKRGNIDEFLAKIEKFDTSKLRFKKKEITSFINNVKRLLTSESSNITINRTLDLNTKEFSTEIESESFEWTAFNYIIVDKIMKDQKNIDKLYIFKKLDF